MSAHNGVAGRWLLPVEAFIRTEQLGSVLLLAATAAALAWANSPWQESYFHFWETRLASTWASSPSKSTWGSG